jgi:hypothetical protein
MRFEAFSLRNTYELQRNDSASVSSNQPALDFLARHNGWLVFLSLLLAIGIGHS